MDVQVGILGQKRSEVLVMELDMIKEEDLVWSILVEYNDFKVSSCYFVCFAYL